MVLTEDSVWNERWNCEIVFPDADGSLCLASKREPFMVKKLINFNDDKVMRSKADDDVLKWLWHRERHKKALVGKNRFGSGGVDQGAAVEGFELDQERGGDEVGIEDL